MDHPTATKGLSAPLFRQIMVTLKKDKRILFAYLYGSAYEGENPKDIDIAVYAKMGVNPHVLSSDLKVNLYNATGLPPDIFDIRVLNELVEHMSITGLLYLKNVLIHSTLLVDNDPGARGDFLEAYAYKYRECEGLMQEFLS